MLDLISGKGVIFELDWGKYVVCIENLYLPVARSKWKKCL